MLADHSDWTTWGTFTDAVAANQSGGFDGIGFVFSANDPYCGVDLDNCRDPASGTIKSWAWDIIRSLASYTEVSPSGTGDKILARGKLPPKGRVKNLHGGKIEIYDTSRYFTITGQIVTGLPTILSNRQAEIDSLHRRLFPQPKQNVPQVSTPAVVPNSVFCLIPDNQIISLLTAKPKYRLLWQGRSSLWTGKKKKYTSQSETDAALVARLARLTPDAAQIDRLFRRSGLMRAKWNEVHYSNKNTYGQSLIATVLRSTQPLFVEISFPPEGYQIHRDDYSAKICNSRSTLTDRNGVFLDRSPCGVGKTTALFKELWRFSSTLISCPTHENCRDFVNLAQQKAVQVVTHPELEQTNCANFQKVSVAQDSGLNVLQTVCRSCPAKYRCGRSGYRSMVRKFRKANHQVVTHDRVSKSGLEFLASYKSLIVVQEDAIGFLRSSAAVPYARWDEVRSLLQELYRRSLQGQYDPQIAGYAIQLLHVHAAIDSVRNRTDLCQITTGQPPVKPPDDWDEAIYHTILATGARIAADALHGVMDLLSGRAEAFYRPERTGKWSRPMQVVVVRRTDLPDEIPTVFEDHTADFDAIQRLAGCPVFDTTSFAFPEAIHRVLQVPVDVTQGTTEKAAVDQLKGILLARPMALRVGVICHRKHKAAIDQIESPFRDRIELVDHFWSGNGRASNRWHKHCDLLIVLGTPRIGESAIQEALIRQGLIDAAKRDGGFTEAIAIGETELGEHRAFLTLSHRDSDWNAAYRQLVAAELIQSVGRSRYIRPEGVPETIVISNEPLDLPLADEEFSRITDKEAELYRELVSAADKQKPRLSQTSHRGGGIPTGTIQRGGARKVPTIYYRDFRAPVSPKPYLPEKGFGYKCLAKITGESPSTVRGRLKRLCDSGLISKCSHSGYWPIVFPG